MNGGTAKIHFSRPVNTSDSRDITIDSDRYLIYARGKLSAGDISQHSFRKASDYFLFPCGKSVVQSNLLMWSSVCNGPKLEIKGLSLISGIILFLSKETYVLWIRNVFRSRF